MLWEVTEHSCLTLGAGQNKKLVFGYKLVTQLYKNKILESL